MAMTKHATERSRIITALGVIAAGVGSGSCIVDEVPACPGQCFEYTVDREIPTKCQDDAGVDYAIAFTGSDPDGYHGRHCFNSPSVAHVVEAIDHLRDGGQLSDLGMEVLGAYVSTVDAVKDDLKFQCMTAAAGQCTNAEQVCTGIAADMYEQLVVDETCVLGIGGVERIELGPGEVCEPIVVGEGTGSAESGEHCVESTTGGADGVDETASSGSDGADETS